jgi:hypothetical protein
MNPEADGVEIPEGYSRRPPEAMGVGGSGGVGEHGRLCEGDRYKGPQPQVPPLSPYIGENQLKEG